MTKVRCYWVSLPLLFWIALVNLTAAVEPAIPAVPNRYFNDYAGIVTHPTADELNQRLEGFEKTNSSQILVVIYPKLPPNAVLEDYTIRAATAWRVGQKAKDNGAILFVFVQDRRMRIEVGYGLEGALPDALANRIIQDEIVPEFRRGDYTAGLTAGVNAMLQAVRGEYKGTGSTVNQRKGKGIAPLVLFLIFLGLVGLSAFSRRRRGTIYSPWGRATRGGWGGGWIGGGGWSGGGGGLGGGGGFSGGGGSFGGGGASGSW